MRRVLSAARNGARMALAGVAVAVAGMERCAGGNLAATAGRIGGRRADQDRSRHASTGAGTDSEEPITLAPVTVEGQGEDASGPVDGYVANESTTGSKTDTPIIENPQSISVISADRLDAQAAGSLAEALRYSAGVTGELFGMVSAATASTSAASKRMKAVSIATGCSSRARRTPPFCRWTCTARSGWSHARTGVRPLWASPPGGLINYVSKRPTAEPSTKSRPARAPSTASKASST